MTLSADMTRPDTGVLVMDLQGLALTDHEREQLIHPAVVGVILFARNFQTRQQLVDLVASIRALRGDLLIMADQEGGRVQRFRGDGFTRVPAMGVFGKLAETDFTRALSLVKDTGWLLAAELRATGFDLGLSPVLDLDRGLNRVIADRSFSHNPEHVTKLAQVFIEGLHEGGTPSLGKHFPGHGGVQVDSHIGLPVDKRSAEELEEDILPYRKLIGSGLDGVMPAHVSFPELDKLPATFSSYWQGDVLRKKLGFTGPVISDCLSMAGARVMGSVVSRVEKALAAGCDATLVCNNSRKAAKVIEAFDNGVFGPEHFQYREDYHTRGSRLELLRGFHQNEIPLSWEGLESSDRRQEIITALGELGASQ